jgi:uncharacterized protein involved in outer membrane biogenesis
MSNGLLYIAGLLTLALAALFAVPYFVDWNGYRGVFEEEATRILGREVRVGGDVNVRLLPAPYVRFDKLRIADPSATTGEPFFRAESFTMKLSVPPLLKGILEANEIELKRPVLRLAVDADGGGNWRTLSIAPGSLPFVPADISLQSVRIKDGMVALQGPKGSEFAQIDGLDGELKADSIDGPFSFKGTANWQGAPRELRIATGATDADGAIRFKTIIRAERGNTYSVDGRLIDLKGRPRLEGEMTAKFELDDAPAEPAAPAPDGTVRTAKAEKAGADFKATLAGDAKGLKLDGITVSFERLGQPQLISGSAEATWSDVLNVELNLASRWLDLDRIAGSGGAKRPLDTAQSFVGAIMDALPMQAETKVRFDIDQANLGGEAVSAIRLEAARSNGALRLKDLRAGLPGGAKLTLDGAVADVANARTFQGDLALRGTSLPRFLTWVTKDTSVADLVRSDGPFSLQGRLSLNDRAIDLTDAGAEVGGMPLNGAVHYAGGERTKLAVVVDAQQIDASQFWPTAVGYLKSMLVGAQPDASKKDSASAPPQPRLDLAKSDFALRMRAAELKTQRQPVRNVDLDLGVEKGRLSMRSCKFTTDDGLDVELDGDIADVTAQPRGALRWTLVVPSKDAFTSLVRLAELPEDLSERAMHYVAFAPARIAGAVELGARTPSAADIRADGETEGGRVVAVARLDGGLAGWRSAPADIELNMQVTDVVQAFDSLAARAASATASAARAQRPGEIFLKAVGTPAQGLLATASVKAAGLFFGYDGQVALPADSANTYDGEVRVSARDLGDAMAIVGLGSGASVRGSPVIGSLKMVSAAGAIEIKPYKLTVGGSKVDGTVALAYPEGGTAIVTAQLEVDQASLPGLLGIALDRRVAAATPTPGAAAPAAPAAPPAAEPLTAGKSIWPESQFDFAGLDGVEGKLGVSFGALSLAPGMAMKNARLEVALAPGKISLTKLEGKAAGGDLLATAALERAPGGAKLAGDLRINGIHLTAPKASDAASAKDGGAALALEFSGAGATPSGLIAVATGQGEVALGDVAAHVPTPLAVVATSEAVLAGAAGGTGEALVAALREQMAASAVIVGPRKIAIAVADGAAKLESFELQTEAGSTKVETTVDLASLVVDSQWVVQPRAPDIEQPDKPRKGALPAVTVVYVGPLKDAWTMEPRITPDQLERELAIRRMELDADQLERLHKLDAERARQDDERRRALAADQAARAAMPPQAVPQLAPQSAPQAVAPPPAAFPPAAPQAYGVRPGIPPQPGPAIPPQQSAQPGQPGQPAQPGAPAPAAAIPEPPQREESGAADVPLVPGQEARVLPPGTAPATGELPPGTPGAVVPEAPQGTYRKRRLPRQVPVGEQVLRSLQNDTN